MATQIEDTLMADATSGPTPIHKQHDLSSDLSEIPQLRDPFVQKELTKKMIENCGGQANIAALMAESTIKKQFGGKQGFARYMSSQLRKNKPKSDRERFALRFDLSPNDYSRLNKMDPAEIKAIVSHNSTFVEPFSIDFRDQRTFIIDFKTRSAEEKARPFMDDICLKLSLSDGSIPRKDRYVVEVYGHNINKHTYPRPASMREEWSREAGVTIIRAYFKKKKLLWSVLTLENVKTLVSEPFSISSRTAQAR